MCDVVSEKANRKPQTGVCVYVCLGVDGVLEWKIFSNQSLEEVSSQIALQMHLVRSKASRQVI